MEHEGRMTLWAGFATAYLRNLIFGLSTVLICDRLTTKLSK